VSATTIDTSATNTTTVDTGISSSYVKSWGMKEAIRELVQNYLDAGGRPEGVQYDETSQILALRNEGHLLMRHLALGVSEKDAEARGQFGEGLKLALLVIAREAHPISISSALGTITCSVRDSAVYGVPTLHLHLDPKARTSHTLVYTTCAPDVWAEVQSTFEEFLPDPFRFISEGLSTQEPGTIWVGGMRVGKMTTPALFSYHLPASEKDLVDRDRKMVDMYKFEFRARLLLGKASAKARRLIIEAALGQGARDRWESMNSPIIDSDDDARVRAWRTSVRRFCGGSRVCVSRDLSIVYNSLASRLGWVVLNVPSWSWEAFLKEHLDFPSTRMAIAQSKAELGKDVVLSGQEEQDLQIALLLVNSALPPDKAISRDNITVVECISEGGDDEKVLGMEIDGHIYLVRSVFSSLFRVVKTLAHEVAHKVSSAPDCSHFFENALTEMLARALVARLGISSPGNTEKSADPGNTEKEA